MSFVTPSGPGDYLFFNVLISASSFPLWMASVMVLSVGVFSESGFISCLTCLVLPSGSYTVISS